MRIRSLWALAAASFLVLPLLSDDVRTRGGIRKPEDLGLTLNGLKITRVERASPAGRAKIRPGGTITRCDGTEVSSWKDLLSRIHSSPYRTSFTLTIDDGTRARDHTICLVKGKRLEFARVCPDVREPIDIGLELEGTSLRVAGTLRGSPVDRQLVPGDEIVAVNGEPVKTWADVRRALEGLTFVNEFTLTVLGTKRARRNRGSSRPFGGGGRPARPADSKGPEKKTRRDVLVRLSSTPAHFSGGSGGASGFVKKEIDVDGTTRKYELRVPAWAAQGKPAPLVVLLHGTNSSTTYMFANWVPVAGKEAILAAPWGNRNWRQDPTDEKFILRMIDEIKKAYNIDLTRIYVTGHSRGAFYTFYLGIKHGNLFAAAGLFAGGMSGPAKARGRKAPFVFYHGELDSSVPIRSGRAAEKALREAGHHVAFYEEKGGTGNPNHHEMNTRGTGKIWEFFKEHPMTKTCTKKHD